MALTTEISRRCRLVSGTTARHSATLQFLATAFPAVAAEEFRALVDDPAYQVGDRILVEENAQVVGHAHLARRSMRFGSLSIPVGQLLWLATAAEHRRQGHGRSLAAAAEARMRRDGLALGLLWTRIPQFFRPLGWTVCGRRLQTEANAHAILGVFLAERIFRRAARRLEIRPFRRMELEAVAGLYERKVRRMFGPLERNLAHWQWLLRRRGYDVIQVALDGRQPADELGLRPLLGYLAGRGERVVELLAAPGRPWVAAELLARAARDAVEQGHHTLCLHAPAASPLHKLMHTAGGRSAAASDRCEVLMARIPDPAALVNALAPRLLLRANAAKLPRPMELTLWAGETPLRIRVDQQGVRAEYDGDGTAAGRRSWLRAGEEDFTRMALGHFDWTNPGNLREIQASSKGALVGARALFPHLRAWHPPLDDLPAQEG